MKTKKEPRLDAHEIQRHVSKHLKKYKKLNAFEQFAMFMGMAQLLEVGLKGLLVRLYKYDSDAIQKWTLGHIAKELTKCGLRQDFITLLESVVTYRNYIAHEYLVNDAILKSILGGDSGRLEQKRLQHGIYELEQVVFLYDWCEEHKAWF
jgi:uncharacterized protein YutE (UPF0331/DUF86 family)